MKEIIIANSISKIYKMGLKNIVHALNEVDLTVLEGEFVAIMGPSGAGKSTLLNCISTIDIPTKGSIKIDGHNINIISEDRLMTFRYEYLGFVFQDYNLIDSLTNYDNIAISLTMHKIKEKEIKERVSLIAKQLQIESLLFSYPNECSGGEQQRVAIARALITNPKLIVGDEPTGNLDSKNRHELMMLFKNMNQDNKTIVIVTHDSVVASYTDRVIYINDGVIEKEIWKEDLSQKDFYEDILDLNAKERFFFDEE